VIVWRPATVLYFDLDGMGRTCLSLHEIWRVQFGQELSLFRCETCMFESPEAALVHCAEQLAKGFVTARDGSGVRAAGREYGEAVLQRRRWTADTGERRGPPANGGFEPGIECVVMAQRMANVDQSEVNMTNFVVAGAPYNLGSHFVRRVSFDEREQIDKRPLAQHGQQKGGLREIFQLQEREQ